MMNIGAVPYYAFPSIGYAINAVKDGRMSVPVAPSAYIYSHFKHVSGTPAPEGVQGVNISKLKILDTLIDQLSKVKNQSIPILNMPGENDNKRIDALIEQLQKQIHSSQNAAPYISNIPATGTLFSIFV
jgi:Icc-related predicted phosphoesterase